MGLGKYNSFVASMRPGTSIWFRRTSDGHAPWVAPPPVLVFAEVIFLAWLTLVLGIAVLEESLAGELADSLLLMTSAVLFGGLLPMLVSYGIATNRLWARLGLLITVMGILGLVAWYVDLPRQSLSIQVSAGLSGTILIAGVAWYLYGSPVARNFYAVLKGRYPSESVTVQPSEPSKEIKSIAMGGRIQLILEYALFLISITLVVVSLVQIRF